MQRNILFLTLFTLATTNAFGMDSNTANRRDSRAASANRQSQNAFEALGTDEQFNNNLNTLATGFTNILSQGVATVAQAFTPPTNPQTQNNATPQPQSAANQNAPAQASAIPTLSDITARIGQAIAPQPTTVGQAVVNAGVQRLLNPNNNPAQPQGPHDCAEAKDLRAKLDALKDEKNKLDTEVAVLKSKQYTPTFFDNNKGAIVTGLLVVVGAGSYIVGRNQGAANSETN
jgi:hypothetical protein